MLRLQLKRNYNLNFFDFDLKFLHPFSFKYCIFIILRNNQNNLTKVDIVISQAIVQIGESAIDNNTVLVKHSKQTFLEH